jgi:(p)ppGpp synthase/HD superfamily hydrolase
MVYKLRLQRAIKFAIKTHDVYQKQTRKGKDIAYITHPLTVGIILARAGASDDVVAAGILHDTIEDSVLEKKVSQEMLAERFGHKVAKLVESVTEPDKRVPWEERKREALEHIHRFNHDSLMVKSADIISNMSELLDDYARYGDEVFVRFHASKEKMLKYQLEAIKAIIGHWPQNPLVKDLKLLAKLLKAIK